MLKGKECFVVRRRKVALLGISLVLIGSRAFAQDVTAIEDAIDTAQGYFDAGIYLMYVIAAILGIIGGVQVYQRWIAGDPNTLQTAASWFGPCISLVLVATVLRLFFGL
ncbi:MAG: DUF4134 domain-containing protein [Chitinophagaceae bacterium]